MFSQRCVLLSLVALVLSVLFTLPPTVSAEEQIVLTVFLNAENKGDYFLILTPEHDVLMKKEDFLSMGLVEASGSTLSVSGEAYISLSSVAGLTFSMDYKNASLTLIAAPNLFEKEALDISYKKPYSVSYTRDTSAFLNYGVQYTAHEPTFNVSTELGIRIGDYLATSSSNYFKNDETNKNVRLFSSIRTDNRAALRTVIAGDAPAVSGQLGSTAVIGGFTIAKNYSVDPYFIRYPSLSLSGTVMTPSEIDVRVNGMTVRRETLQPGQFRFNNVPAIVGLGTADVVIKDAFGRETVILQDFYYSDRLLQKGLHEYSYSVGFIREDIGTKSFSYGKAVVLAFHNYGFSSDLKGGVALEASTSSATFGPTASFLISRIGVFDSGLAMSASEGKTGWGAYLNYSFLSPVFNASAFVQSLSRNYSNLSLSPADDKSSLAFSVSVGATDKTLGSISLAYSLSRMYVQPDTKRYGASYTKIMTNNVTLFAIASRTDDQNGKNDQLFFGLNIYFGKGISGNLNYTFKNGNNIAEANLQKNLPTGPGYGFNIDVANQDSRSDVRGLIQYQNDYGIYGVGYRRIDRQEDYLLSAAGGIGYIDGSGFLSRPILDGFAKVNVDGLEGVRVYEFGNEIGKTDKNGNVIIPDFRSFIDNKIDIENRDIPINYSISALTQYISPPFRGGSLVRFDVTKIQAISGRVFLVEDDRKISLESGNIKVYVGGKIISGIIGRNGEFYIENVPHGNHSAQVTYDSKKCHFELTIPKSQEMWIDIGEVTCSL
ncbi:putative Sigma-fimbria biogenesis outer membrane usher protein [Candidatus Sulfobium mesophilum]|uniref:Putative Sigma-fimbria biogenesis outer membrane usher protein n=1 Tax=Candidatus Sulfobium mesophilum TaxID=2016548 RepID=A0A2U3QGS9_9BACT|nr:putative Sigma-fimbria biogenesis outer membrane usher protein [Candidatus Sulfobium mesophilum]